VIRRYRLREVTERMAAGADIDWAALAADLGYTDQAHFVRDFRSMFGESPTHYAQRY
jgi:AraC-like DNA-binding protein